MKKIKFTKKSRINKELSGWFKLLFIIVLILWITFGYQWLESAFGSAKTGFIITTIVLLFAVLFGIFKPKFILKTIRSRL